MSYGYEALTFDHVLRYYTGKHIGVRDWWWYLNRVDECGEGCLWDLDRWTSTLKPLDLDRHSSSEWEHRFIMADKDGDGSIDGDEFYQWFAKGWIPYINSTHPDNIIKSYGGPWQTSLPEVFQNQPENTMSWDDYKRGFIEANLTLCKLQDMG